MKKTCTTFGVISLTMAALSQPVPPPISKPPAKATVRSAIGPSKDNTEPIVIPAGYSMQAVPLDVMLKEYGDLVGRTLITAQNLPKVEFSFMVNNPLTYEEAQAFYETLLSQRAIAVVPLGKKFVQVIPAAEVTKTPPKFTIKSADELPEGQIYIIKAVVF